MDANKTAGEEARRQLHKNAACNLEQVLAATPHKTATCLLSRKLFKLDELIRDVLLWTPAHGRAKAGRPARTYIQQLCEDTGCCPEDLPRAMNDREEWRERVRDIRATSATWWWWFIIIGNGWLIQILDEAICISYSAHNLEKVLCIQLFFLQLWVISRADWAFPPWYGNWSRRGKTQNSNLLKSS